MTPSGSCRRHLSSTWALSRTRPARCGGDIRTQSSQKRSGGDIPFYDPTIEALTHGDLLTLAAGGDRSAWEALVDRFGQMVWSMARGFRLDEAAAKDVAQTVWLKLVENVDSIKDPERLPGWLATTTRREALRVVRARSRDIPTEFEYDVADPTPALDEILVDVEESRLVVRAFSTLDVMCRQLLRLMTVEPALSYEEISEMIGRPVGSLGPTRARCLEKLRSALSRITGGADDSFLSGGSPSE